MKSVEHRTALGLQPPRSADPLQEARDRFLEIVLRAKIRDQGLPSNTPGVERSALRLAYLEPPEMPHAAVLGILSFVFYFREGVRRKARDLFDCLTYEAGVYEHDIHPEFR